MTTINEQRIAGFGVFIDALRQYLSETDFIEVDRQQMADSLEIPKQWVDKALCVLHQKLGAVEKGRKSWYKALPGLQIVTPEATNEAYLAYQHEHSYPREKQDIVTQEAEPTPAQGELFITPEVNPRTIEYGYVIATSIAYFNSIEEAAEEGQRQALLHGMNEVSIVQRLAVVEVQKPIIRML